MGCCSSDLKGEKQADITDEPKPQPIKKVATNFSTVDYEASATGRRDTIVAPHEEANRPTSSKQKTIPEEDDIAPGATPGAAPTSELPGQPTIAGIGQLNTGLTQDPITRNEEQVPLSPYRDVTASPTSPVEKNPLDAQLAHATQPNQQAEPKQ